MAYFPSTKWSQLINLAAEAGQGNDSSTRGRQADAALNDLCGLYWYPLYAYARSLGKSHDSAQDLTQSFFAHLVESRLVARADRGKARFRTFLLTHFKFVISNEWRKGRAARRGGGAEHLSLSMEGADERFQPSLADGRTPDSVYDQAWASEVVDRAWRLLETEFEKSHSDIPFSAFKGFLPGATTVEHPSYAELERRYPGAKRQAWMTRVSRLRKRFRELLIGVIADTVADPVEVNAELRHLILALNRD